MSGLLRRLGPAWRALTPDQRLAGVAAGSLFLTMFLPWYTKDTNAVVKGRLQSLGDTLVAWEAFSFVEAAVLLVAVGTLVLLFHRGERRAFHLPGGDGTVLVAAGAWVCLLVFWRTLDKPDGQQEAGFKTDYGVTWGIFVTFVAGLLLAYAGWRIRTAHIPEPVENNVPPPEAETVPAPAAAHRPPPDAEPTVVARRPRPADEAPVEGQLSFEEPEPPTEPAEFRPPPRRGS